MGDAWEEPMSKPIREPRIEIAGSEAEAIERELQELLQAEWGANARRVESPTRGPEREGEKIDTATIGIGIGIAALILQLPGAVKDSLDLAERIKLTQKVKRLLAWAQAKKQQNPEVRITLVSPEGRSHELDRAEPGEIVEAVSERDAAAPPPARPEK
jgi:hypothetical protein